jgi:hypothetical protein
MNEIIDSALPQQIIGWGFVGAGRKRKPFEKRSFSPALLPIQVYIQWNLKENCLKR